MAFLGIFGKKKQERKAESRLKKRYYRAPADKNSPGGWAPSIVTQERAPSALPFIRARARDLSQNNPYASRAVSVISAHAVGKGIFAAIRGDDDFAQSYLEWSQTINTDFDMRMSFYAMQSVAVRTMIEAGDSFIIIRDQKINGQLTTTLQLIDPDQIDEGAPPFKLGNRVIQGVEVTPTGQVFGYHIRPYLEALVSQFYYASDVCHFMEHLYPGQVRGIPRGAQALVRAKTADDFLTIALARARVEACLTAFVTGEQIDDNPLIGDQEEGNQSEFVIPEYMEPGTIVPLPVGSDIKIAQPPSSGGLLDYLKISLQAVASAYSVTYSQISSDLQGVNFSSGKTGLVEFHRNIDVLRSHSINPQILKILKRFKKAQEANRGISIDATMTMVHPGRESIEPLKDATARQIDLMLGIKTWSQCVRETGNDPDEQMLELASIARKFKEMGINLDFNMKTSVGPVDVEEDLVPAKGTSGNKAQ